MQRYRGFNRFLREKFGERIQKIALDAGLTCPNRDGTISTKGCIYCDRRGSGTGALIDYGMDISEQLSRTKAFIQKRYKAHKFIAYFQSFTNTYAPAAKLKQLYDLALSCEDIVGLSIATRPDCIDEEIMSLLASYKTHHMVWLELGLQSAHDATLKRINRGHDVACFVKAVEQASKFDLNICVHVILGLPGEDRGQMLETARFVSGLPVQGIKIHVLYVVDDAPIARLYKEGSIKCLDRDQYVDLVVDFLELLPPDMIVQRLTGDPPRGSRLLAPQWARDKMGTLSVIKKRLEERNTWQGRLYKGSLSIQ